MSRYQLVRHPGLGTFDFATTAILTAERLGLCPEWEVIS